MRQRRRIAAYGVCRDDAGRLLLTRGSPGGTAMGVWNLPGGGVDHGEHPRAALVREFAEETGLAAGVVGLHGILSDLAVLADRDEVVHTDRVLYDVKVTGAELRHEVAGTSDLAAWLEPAEVAGLPLLPHVSRLLGLPVTGDPQIPVAELVRDPAATRMQRFAAYGLTTDPAGRFLLTRIAPGYPGAGTWHMPGGGTDFGEQADAGLLRELAEETSQVGRVTGLLDITHYHNPRAHGPEGRPMDWHTVRAVYRVVVDTPGVPSVAEAAGGSTADARWFDRAELGEVPLNEFARRTITHHGS